MSLVQSNMQCPAVCGHYSHFEAVGQQMSRPTGCQQHADTPGRGVQSTSGRWSVRVTGGDTAGQQPVTTWRDHRCRPNTYKRTRANCRYNKPYTTCVAYNTNISRRVEWLTDQWSQPLGYKELSNPLITQVVSMMNGRFKTVSVDCRQTDQLLIEDWM